MLKILSVILKRETVPETPSTKIMLDWDWDWDKRSSARPQISSFDNSTHHLDRPSLCSFVDGARGRGVEMWTFEVCARVACAGKGLVGRAIDDRSRKVSSERQAWR